MTEQKAIELLRFAFPKEITKPITEEVISMAVAALEKQIPKKLVVKESEDETMDMETGEWIPCIRGDLLCPICGEYITHYDDPYCSNCGQKLDWWEEVEE